MRNKRRRKAERQQLSKKVFYGWRRDALQRIGFKSYGEYLRSDLWKSIKERVLDRDGKLCQVCYEREAFYVHHESYGDVTLRGDRLDKLISICGGCHRWIELRADGSKASPDQVRKAVNVRRRFWNKQRMMRNRIAKEVKEKINDEST